MGHVEHIPEGERSLDSSDDFHPPEQPRAALRLLRVRDVAQAQDLLEKYAKLNIPKEHLVTFSEHLLYSKNAYFLEHNQGLVYFTNIVPRWKADLSFVFWDEKLGKDRRELIRGAIRNCVEDFALKRLQASTVVTNVPLVNSLKKIGFVWEGTLRRGWVDGSEMLDQAVFSLLPEEIAQWR